MYITGCLKKIPDARISKFVVSQIGKIDYFPEKGGVPKYYSPQIIMHQQELDCDKNYQIPF